MPPAIGRRRDCGTLLPRRTQQVGRIDRQDPTSLQGSSRECGNEDSHRAGTPENNRLQRLFEGISSYLDTLTVRF